MVLYERMRPIANQAEECLDALSQGSYGQFCGMLAACLGRWDDAERHFTDALAMNERLGARPSIVRTRRAWAAMLLDRNDPSRPGDRESARDLIAAGRAEAEQLGLGARARALRAVARTPGVNPSSLFATAGSGYAQQPLSGAGHAVYSDRHNEAGRGPQQASD